MDDVIRDKVDLFVSYSHDDKEGLKELFNYVNDQNCPQIQIWHDEKISLGQEWDEKIKDQLNKADIVLLLVSQPFLLSKYVRDNELNTALTRHEKKEATVIPIFYRYCNLDKYPSITCLQGYPDKEKPLYEAGVLKDRLYTEIQQKLNEIADKIVTNRKILEHIQSGKNDELARQAQKIENLKTTNKIFVSIPNSPAGLELRNLFITTVENKIKYDQPPWPYEIVPTNDEAREILQLNGEERRANLQSILDECVYDIHIAGTNDDFKSDLFKEQYILAKNANSRSPRDHTILWFENSGIHLEGNGLAEDVQLELRMLPTVIEPDSKAVFKLIEDFDVAKHKMINDLSAKFSSLKKIFMFYDFEKDNDNRLRIDLRKKIQMTKDYTILDPADESFENQLKEINECNGAVIFYGPESSSMWYRTRQKIILKQNNIRAGAVCVDGPESELKIDRDVRINEIMAIKGEPELETGVQQFKKNLEEKL